MADLLVLDPTGERARLLLAARSAPVAAAGFLGSLVGYALLGGVPVLGPLADMSAILLALAAAGLAAGTAELTWRSQPRATTAVAILGVMAGLAAAALTVAAMVGGRAFQGAQGAGFAAPGIWLVAWDLLALRQKALPAWCAVAGVMGGTGFIVGGIVGDAPGMLALVGVLAVGFLPWAWGVRRALFDAAVDERRGTPSAGVNA